MEQKPSWLEGMIAPPKNQEPEETGNLGAVIKVTKKQNPKKSIPDLINEYRDILVSQGFHIEGNLQQTNTDSPNRCEALDTRNGKKPCWYYMTVLDDAVFGTYGDWRTDFVGKFSSFTVGKPTNQRIAEVQILMHDQAERSKQERLELQKGAIRYVNQKISMLKGVKSHQYITNKEIIPILSIANIYEMENGTPMVAGNNQDAMDLIIPMYQSGGEIVNWQKISPKGDKLFKKSAPKKGSFHVISTLSASKYVVYCEGFATGASIHLATGATVIVAFDAGNLLPVIYETKDMVAGKSLYIGADNDVSNVGEKYADKCIEAFPEITKVMPPSKKGQSVDFNDLHVAKGLDVVKDTFVLSGMDQAEEEQPEVWDEEDQRHKIEDQLLLFPCEKMNRVVEWMKQSAVTTSHAGAMLGAIGLACGVAGRNYREVVTKNYSPIYGLLIAPSGGGKDFIQSCIKMVLTDNQELNKILGSSTFTSEAALRNHLMEHPNRLSIMDEFGNKMERGHGKGSGTDKQVFETCKSLYSDSRTSTLGRAYAPKDGSKMEKDYRSTTIINPCLSIIGMSTPHQFIGAITPADIEGGLINRFIIIDAEFEEIIDNMDFDLEAPDWLVRHCKEIATQGGRLESLGDIADLANTYDQKPNPMNVMVGQGVKEFWAEYRIALRKKYIRDFTLGNLSVRWVENAIRICVGMAAFENPKNPIITISMAKWAVSFVQAHGIRMAKLMDRYATKDHKERTMNEMVEVMRKRGSKGLSKTEMNKVRPFRGMMNKERDMYLNQLKEDGRIGINIYSHIDYRNRVVYYALKE